MDEEFAYAYTLLGHEYTLTEDYEKAMSAFRSALRADSRHYNAWSVSEKPTCSHLASSCLTVYIMDVVVFALPGMALE